METNKLNTLISKYNEGLADPAEVAELERLIESGILDITELHDLQALHEKIMGTRDNVPSMKLDDQFYQMLAKEKKSLPKPMGSFSWDMFLHWLPSTGFSVAILIVGLIGGYLFNYFQPNQDVKELSSQIANLREMMMLTLLEKESVTERLKAVSLTSDLTEVSHRVTDALIQVLNNDPNVNVRLATLDALAEYANTAEVRVQLVKSISHQDSPLVQIALADLMVALNEKSSVGQLKKIMEGKATPNEVKIKLKESIDILI